MKLHAADKDEPVAENLSWEAHISADLPIRTVGDDRLKRSGFARALATVIRRWRNKPSLVIALFGDWGSGKSSLKNLVLEELSVQNQEKPLVVEFSPWQVSGQELLSELFFREIGRALERTGPPEEATTKRRVARWKMYSGIFSMAATVARAYRSALAPTDHVSLALSGAAAAVEGIAAVTKSGSEAVEAEGALGKLSLAELKEQIAEDLRSLDMPILIVLDDIDRLSKEEIRLTLQLVKANADFPNIIYLLLAQKDTVIQALEDVAPGNAHAYLEKIVQVSFDIPVINDKQLKGLLLKGLDELLTGPAFEERFSNQHWQSIFAQLFPLFRNLRDVNRFLGALAFHIHLFSDGATFEVNPVDLIALECLRLFEPNVYKNIPREKEVLTHISRGFKDKNKEDDKRRVDNLVDKSTPENRLVVRSILFELFPSSNISGTSRFSGRDVESNWFSQLRVCSHQAFDRYFQFATPEGDVSQAEIDHLIRAMSSTSVLDQIFSELMDRDLLDVMLERIDSLKETLPLEHASTFLAAIYQIPVPFKSYGFLETSPKDHLLRITYWYLQRLPQEQRLRVMEKAADLTKGIWLLISVIAILIHPKEVSRVQPFFESTESKERLKLKGLNAITRAASDRASRVTAELCRVLHFWASADKVAAKDWLLVHLQSRVGVVQYLESIISVSEGTGGTKRYIHVLSFEYLISVEEFAEIVSQQLTGELSGQEAAVHKMFFDGLKRRRDGKENDPFPSDEED